MFWTKPYVPCKHQPKEISLVVQNAPKPPTHALPHRQQKLRGTRVGQKPSEVSGKQSKKLPDPKQDLVNRSVLESIQALCLKGRKEVAHLPLYGKLSSLLTHMEVARHLLRCSWWMALQDAWGIHRTLPPIMELPVLAFRRSSEKAFWLPFKATFGRKRTKRNLVASVWVPF